MPDHFITGAELDADRLDLLLHRAAALKEAPLSSRALEGRTIALVFNKPSTRTRTSFESGVFELGGHPMVLRPDEMQLTRGESIRDTALILSRHAAVIGLRTGDEDEINGFAEHATVPVVNMLSPLHHPCQALADLQTMREALGTLDGRSWPTSATATTSPARWPSSVRWRVSRCVSPRPPATSCPRARRRRS